MHQQHQHISSISASEHQCISSISVSTASAYKQPKQHQHISSISASAASEHQQHQRISIISSISTSASVSKAAEERGWRLQAATLHYKHSLFLPCPYFHFGLLGLWEDVLTTWAWIGELVGLRHREDERAMESDGLICGSPTRIDWLFCQQWFL